MDAVGVHAAADDGARPLLLRSGGECITRSIGISMTWTKRYGGIDAVLIWATYPNMGIDDRNQLDMVRSMPGGVEGVRRMVADFHRRGVRVLFPMMMWDQGTHDPGMPWPDAMAGLMKEIDADGMNGDTQDGVPLAFSLAAEKIGHPLAFEPEGGPHDEGAGVECADVGAVHVSVCADRGSVSLAGAAAPGAIFKGAGCATRRTIYSLHSSTARGGRAGRTCGASGMA